MTPVIPILAILVLIVAAMRVYERVRLDRHRRQIPIRIHVNGTRGKSSCTRLIGGALRGGGLRVVAKATGTAPRIIYEDGSEIPLHRLGKPNLREQFHVMGLAAARQPDALVIECMAVNPHYQWLAEHRIVQATIGVITNARADHLDVMGPTEEDVALALCGTIPKRGRVVTCERRHLAIFHRCAAELGAEVVPVTVEDVADVPDELMQRFTYYEHKENVALALKVAALCGVARDRAIAGMLAATPDAGAFSLYRVDFFGRDMIFAQGFAANDPESSQRIWDLTIQAFPEVTRRIVVLNLRADRADRSRQLGEAVATWAHVDRVVIMGTGTQIAAREAVAAGLDPLRLVFAEDASAPDVFEQIVALVEDSAVIVGIGNVAGAGLPLVGLFRNRGRRVPLTRFFGPLRSTAEHPQPTPPPGVQEVSPRG